MTTEKTSRAEPVEVVADLADVVARLKKVIPEEILLELFTSSEAETGGRRIFPYCRVDSSAIIASNCCYLLNHFPIKSPEYFDQWYTLAAKHVFKALVWIEIGFEGLQNLAINNASRNWTSAVGHFVNDEQRAAGIMTTGQEMLSTKIKDFVNLRKQHAIKQDIFTKYHLEYLLDPYQ